LTVRGVDGICSPEPRLSATPPDFFPLEKSNLELTSSGGRVNDEAKIRVKGKGSAGEAGPGDLFILLHVKPYPIYSRKGEHISMTLPVTFTEAALGADIKVPTISGGDVTVRLAPGTPNGRVLRVKGRGVEKGQTTGDLLVTVEAQVPRHTEGKAIEALKAFAEATAHEDVRAEFIFKASH